MATAPTIAPPIPYAGYVGANMVSQAVPFVDPATGVLAPVPWRFLYMTFNAVNQLDVAMSAGFTNIENQLTGITNDITDLYARTDNLNSAVSTIETQLNGITNDINTLFADIATINTRLANAGIP